MREFDEVYKETISVLKNKYPHKEEKADRIIQYLLVLFLTELKEDIARSSFLEFYFKHDLLVDMLDREDVPRSEVLHFIDESFLSERDRQMALLRYSENFPEEVIADKLMLDRRTAHTNLKEIANILRRTAYNVYRVDVVKGNNKSKL